MSEATFSDRFVNILFFIIQLRETLSEVSDTGLRYGPMIDELRN